jgi:uncharacterized protein YndB with AHSA1/START domain
MATTIADNVVELEVFIKATPEAVFPFLIEPDKMKRWMSCRSYDLSQRVFRS